MRKILFLLFIILLSFNIFAEDTFVGTDWDNFILEQVYTFTPTDWDSVEYKTGFDFVGTDWDSLELVDTRVLKLDFSKHVSYNIRQIVNYYGLNYININKFILDVNNKTGQSFNNLREMFLWFESYKS